MIFLFFALFVLGKCYSQCLQNSIQNIFSYECITGNPNGARIGFDSIAYTISTTEDAGFITLSDQNFHLYINGQLMSTGSGLVYVNDVVKLYLI
jgi:hypothetical protein